VDQYDDLAREQAQCVRRLGQIYFFNAADLNKMIARSESPDLLKAAFQSAVADEIGVRRRQPSTLFHVGEIFVAPIACFDRPARAVAQKPLFILFEEFRDRAFGADAGGNMRKNRIDDTA